MPQFAYVEWLVPVQHFFVAHVVQQRLAAVFASLRWLDTLAAYG
jgi:hypothetical protein